MQRTPTRRAKLGLALSGGGFRASFFHLGVLKRLAELDLLRHVEVLSTVSGGSIIGALYILLLKREIEQLEPAAHGELDQAAYQKIVDEVERLLVKGVRKNLRTRLVMNPFRLLGVMLTPNRLADRMARMYERHLYAAVTDQLRTAETKRNGDVAPQWRRHSIPLTAVRFMPPGESFGSGLDAYNRNHRTKIPKFVLNATCLNSGRNWRFTSVEIGDPLLGIFRADEIGLLPPDRMREAGFDKREWDLFPRLKAELRARSKEQLLQCLKDRRPHDCVSVQIWLAEYMLRLQDEGKEVVFPDTLDPGLYEVPTRWQEKGLALGDLLNAEAGDLYRVKVEAWYLRRGAERYRASGSEQRLWAGLRKIAGDKVTEIEDYAGSHPDFRDKLWDFLIDLYYARTARVVGPHITKDVGKICLADAVAASACFPPVFAPYSFLGIYDDRHVSEVRLTDGGVFDNQGLTALYEEECTHIIASDAGGLLAIQQRAPGSRLPMMARVISVLMGALRDQQLKHLREERRVNEVVETARARIDPPSETLEKEAHDHYVERLAFFHMTTPPEKGLEDSLEPHRAAQSVARIRTDLDAFGDAEIAALVYQGYGLCDRFVRKYLSGEPYSANWTAPEAPPTPPRLEDRERERQILEVGAGRLFRALRLWVVESWVWIVIAVGAFIGLGWLVEISLRDVLDGMTRLLQLMRFDLDRHVPIGLVVAVILAAVGLLVAWPSVYRKLRRWTRVMSALKLVKAWSGLLLLPIFLLPLWIAVIVPLLAAYSHWCHARPFLRATQVRHHRRD